MNSKLKLMTDTTCDILPETARKWNIELLSIPIAVEGKGYYEGRDFTKEQFYDLLLRSKEVPVTSRINAPEYLERYRRFAEEGYEDILNVTINAKGSGTYDSALLAKKQFQEQYPELAGRTRIHVMDSGSYSYGYGYPMLRAAEMLNDCADTEEVLEFVQEWLQSAEVYLACYSLDFAKKSGRIHSAAAFVGELLGLRPIIRMIGAKNDVISKVRGDKNVVPALCDISAKALVKGGEYCIIRGSLDQPEEDLIRLMTERIGYPPAAVEKVGPCVAINSGPKIIATVLRGKRRIL